MVWGVKHPVTFAMSCTQVGWELRWWCAHHPVKTIPILNTLNLLFRVDYLVWFYKELWIMTRPLQKHDLLRELKICGEIECIICLSNLCNSHSQFSDSVCVLYHWQINSQARTAVAGNMQMLLFCVGLQSSSNHMSATGSRRSLNYFSVFFQMSQKEAAKIFMVL